MMVFIIKTIFHIWTCIINSYGTMLQLGIGFPANKEKACYYFKLAADHGNAKAMNSYAHMLQFGEGKKLIKLLPFTIINCQLTEKTQMQ